MMLKIGEKIKELREKKNITQNKMAEYLGITEQAISRWENGGGYPDMELIPAISNFLEVSTDTLFETDKKAERLKSLLRETDKHLGWDSNTVRKRIEIYRDILKEFPNSYSTMSLLITSLMHDYPYGMHSEEIIALCNRIINDSPDINLRRQETCSLAQEYKDMGEQEKAVQIIKESPIICPLSDGVAWSRERILSDITEGEETLRIRRDILDYLFHCLCTHMSHLAMADARAYSNADKSSTEYLNMLRRGIIIHEKIDKIMEIFFEDGDYAFAREGMVYDYAVLAQSYITFGEYDKALDNIEKCAETAIIFDTEKPGAHTSILVKGIKIYGDYHLSNYGNHAKDIRYNQSYRLIHDHDWFLNNERYAPICEHERFKSVIANLEKYAKVENE